MVPLKSLIKCLTILCCSRCIAVHLKVGTCARGLCILSAFRSVSVEICCNWSWVWFLLIIDFGTLRTHHFKNTGHYIGNCHWPVFSLGGSHHMYKVTNLCKFKLNRSSELRDNYERTKYPCPTKLCAFRCLISRPKILNLSVEIKFVEKYFFLENYVTLEGAVSHSSRLPVTM